MTRTGGEPPGLYVHVPFCATKCPYCDFFSVPEPGLIPAWLDALATEARLGAPLWPAFDTLYVGGGTPSVLDGAALTRLFSLLRETFAFLPGTEVTIEANPDDCAPEKLGVLRDLGVTRLSIGAQSLNDAELRFLGRRHDAAAIGRAVFAAGDLGFEDIGLDLMYGLPGQSLAGWRETLGAALALAPEHLSCYQLTVAEGTPFGERAAAGGLHLPDEEDSRAFFLETSAYLRAHGFIHYEISNFARGETLRSRHNMKYWRHVPYLGLGPAAHSFSGRKRWWNARSVSGYCEALAAGGLPVAGSETLTDGELTLETVALGFRTREGVALSDLPETPRREAALHRLVAEGLVRIEGGRALPTPEGMCVADGLPLLFFE